MAVSSGFLFALAAAASYGLNIAFARLASFDGVSGTAIVFYRVILVLVLAGIAIPLLRQSLRVVPGERLPLAILSGVTAVVGLAYLSSVAFIPVTVAVVILYTFPMLIVIAAPFIDGTPRDLPRLGLAALAFVGVTLVVGPNLAGLDWRGLALAGIASVGAAIQFFSAARCPRTPTLSKIVWIHLLVLPITALIGLGLGDLPMPGTLLNAPFAVAATIAGYVVGFGFQILALARSNAAAAGIAFCAEPVVAALSSMIVLGERMDAVQAVGGLLVIAAIIANVLRDQNRIAAQDRGVATASGSTP